MTICYIIIVNTDVLVHVIQTPTTKSYLVQGDYAWTAWPLKMELAGCPKTLVNIYQSALRNIPEQQRSQCYDVLYHAFYTTDQKPYIPMQSMTYFSQNNLWMFINVDTQQSHACYSIIV